MKWRFVPIMLLAVSGVLATTATASAAPPPASDTYNCAGGNVPSGTYISMIITGVCYMPTGTIVVQDNLTVAPGALLDAATPGDPADNPQLPATVLVGGNVFVGAGAVLFLGCSPFIFCSNAVTYDHIGGNLTAIKALGVVVHSVSIGGNFSLLGGGGGVIGGVQTGVCDGSFTTVPPTPAPVPPLWAADPSLANGEAPGMPIPVYSDAEDNVIGGNLSVIGLKSCWLGSLRNEVRGSAVFFHNSMGDPDAMEIDNNLIGRDMLCFGNLPAVQYGDSGAAPNMVRGFGLGECGFNVLVPNPAPEAGEGPGIPEHIAVGTGSLGNYSGTLTQRSTESFVFGTTESNETLVGESNTDVLAGTGLTGPVSEGIFGTVRPDGSESFYADDTCTCSFDGQSGTVTILAKGRTSVSGLSTGTFLIISGTNGLATLAGYGSFSNFGQPAGTVSFVEHLSIT